MYTNKTTTGAVTGQYPTLGEAIAAAERCMQWTDKIEIWYLGEVVVTVTEGGTSGPDGLS